MLADRGVAVDHTTLFRWVQAYAEDLEQRVRRHLRMAADATRPVFGRVSGRCRPSPVTTQEPHAALLESPRLAGLPIGSPTIGTNRADCGRQDRVRRH